MRELKDISSLINTSAEITLGTLLAQEKGERVLILANPTPEIKPIADALNDRAKKRGGETQLLYQSVKSKLEFMDQVSLKALQSNPEIIISLTEESAGLDYEAIKNPIVHKGIVYDHYFYYLMGASKSRSAWCPNITTEIFAHTVDLDYSVMWRRSARLKKIFDAADSFHVTTPAGTELEIGVRGRKGLLDDGDYRKAGLGGNLPAGEVFISPAIESVDGIAVIDGSMGLDMGAISGMKPIRLEIRNGYVRSISENPSGSQLKKCLERGEKRIVEMQKKMIITPELEKQFLKNNIHIGEFGIGLNPSARITGNMLEDEKALNTCHIAIGNDYDGEANTLMHLDGIMLDPEIIARFPDGSTERAWPE